MGVSLLTGVARRSEMPLLWSCLRIDILTGPFPIRRDEMLASLPNAVDQESSWTRAARPYIILRSGIIKLSQKVEIASATGACPHAPVRPPSHAKEGYPPAVGSLLASG